MSLVTVMLYASIASGAFFNLHELTIGGLNETEMIDLKTIAPLFPENSEVEMYGAWSVNFRVSNFTGNTNYRMSVPPVHTVAPFISRIKGWGYRITFYNCYAGDIQFQPSGQLRMPIMSYTWMLEKDVEDGREVL